MHLILVRKSEVDNESFLESLRIAVPGITKIPPASLAAYSETEKHRDNPVVVIDQSNSDDHIAPDILAKLLDQTRVILIVREGVSCSIFEQMRTRNDTAVIAVTAENSSSFADVVKLWAGALDAASLRSLDQKAKKLGASERILIENASSNLCAEITRFSVGPRGLVIAGGGNNGADVLSCARKLLSKGYELDIVLVAPREPNKEVSFQRDLLRTVRRVRVIAQSSDIPSLDELIRKKDFILEGIFGIGLNRTPQGVFAEVIECINNSRLTVISCDIPSGLPCDRKDPSPHAVKADYTVTFLAAKRGFFLNGLEFCGKIIVTDIGFSQRILNG